MLNINQKKFEKLHKKKKNQVLFFKIKTNGKKEIQNLINNFLIEKNSFIFESVEKGVIKGRYTIFGKNPDKIWEFNENKVFSIIDNKKKLLKGKPVKMLSEIIEKFKFETQKILLISQV